MGAHFCALTCVQHLRSCTQERRMNVIPDLVQRAPRMGGEPEQILLRFLGLEPHARCDLREKMFRVRVHFEHLP